MKRGILVGVVGVAMVVGVAGCSSNNSSTSSSGSSSSTSSTASAEKVIVGGQTQNVTGTVSCVASGSNINIGIGDPTDGIGAVVTNADPPGVLSVGLGSVNGVTMGYSNAAPNNPGNAQATKTGNSYKITGTATGVNTANPQQPVTQPFEIDVTCP